MKMVFLKNFQFDAISENQTGLQVKKATCLLWHPALQTLVIFPWFNNATEKQIATFLKKSGFAPDAVAKILFVANEHEFWNGNPLCIKFCKF